MGILTILFSLTFLVFLPLGQLIRIPIGNGLALVGLDLIVVITAIYWLGFTLFKKQKPSAFFLPITIFLGIGVLSLLVNIFWLKGIDLLISFLYLLRFAAFIACLWIAQEISKKSQILIKNILLIGGGIVMILGLLQYAFYPSLHPYLYLGWDDHFYRVFSTFLDPNFVGAFLVLYFFYAVYLFLQNKQKKFFALSLIMLISVFLTYSRSAYVMLIAGVILFLWLSGLRKWITGAVVGIGIIFILLTVFHRYGEGNNLLRTVSISSRLGSMSTAVSIFTKEPILGVGFNSYRYAQRKYGFLQGNVWEITHAGAGTSNSYLFVLATTGILGFGAYLYLLFTFLKRGFAVMKKNRLLGILVIVSIISLCINAFFENTLFYPSIMLWIFTLMGLDFNIID